MPPNQQHATDALRAAADAERSTDVCGDCGKGAGADSKERDADAASWGDGEGGPVLQ